MNKIKIWNEVISFPTKDVRFWMLIAALVLLFIFSVTGFA